MRRAPKRQPILGVRRTCERRRQALDIGAEHGQHQSQIVA